MRHQLCDQLDGGRQADTQQADQMGVLHAGHNQGLLNEKDINSGMWGDEVGVGVDLCQQCDMYCIPRHVFLAFYVKNNHENMNGI